MGIFLPDASFSLHGPVSRESFADNDRLISIVPCPMTTSDSPVPSLHPIQNRIVPVFDAKELLDSEIGRYRRDKSGIKEKIG